MLICQNKTLTGHEISGKVVDAVGVTHERIATGHLVHAAPVTSLEFSEPVFLL